MIKGIKDIIIGIVVGITISSIIGVVAANINANSVSFDNNHTGFTSTTLDGAVDELITLVDNTVANDKSKKVYTNGEVVYYNPVTNRGCTESEWNNNSSTGTKTGCMRWFAYLDEAGQDKVKLLLDHNTTATKAWYSSSTYKLLPQSDVYSDLVALVKTSNWKVQPTLIDANDVAKITGKTNNNSIWSSSSTSNYFYFDTNSTSAPSTYSGTYWWLYDRTYSCTSYGCHTADSSNYGYWTSTNVGTSGSSVWVVYYSAYLNGSGATFTNFGVRPVVNVYKSNL